MESSCQGLDVDQETLTGDMNEGDSLFETNTYGEYNMDEVSYYTFFILYLCTCIHLVFSLTCFFLLQQVADRGALNEARTLWWPALVEGPVLKPSCGPRLATKMPAVSLL